MHAAPRLVLFLTAASLLAIAPGPGMLYVLARSLAGGKRDGVLSACGTFVGGLGHVLAAALGVSMILAKSAVAFSAVKYVGAAYLGFLGIRMILGARGENFDPQTISPALQSGKNPLWQGVATEVLNPKTALFFLSFIPQFVSPSSGHVFLQFLMLGTISVLMNTTADFKSPARSTSLTEIKPASLTWNSRRMASPISRFSNSRTRSCRRVGMVQTVDKWIFG